MCFTIEVHLTRKTIEERFKVDATALYDFDFHYFYRAFANPEIPVIPAHNPSGAELMQWGLIPSWVKDSQKAKQIRKGTYNARAESLHEKPSFRGPLKKGRCLVLAHGFFEWQHEKGARIPWYIRLKNNAPFAFAGLSDTWADPETGELLKTFSIVTTKANPMMEKIHNTRKRMPVILPPHKESEWLSGDVPEQAAQQLLVPFDQDQLEAYRVSKVISDPRANPADPAVIEPHHPPTERNLF